MNDIKPYAVLEYVVNLIKNTISDIKIEYSSTSTATLKDGNDTLYLEQRYDSTGNLATIFIDDPREIIYSEDLLEPLKTLYQGTTGNLKVALQTATVLVNEVDVETHLILQTVKDGFDQLSNSYEFIKIIDNEISKVRCSFKFGKHQFEITVMNEADLILVVPEFSSSFEIAVKKTIAEDAFKVQNAVKAIYREDKVIDKALD